MHAWHMRACMERRPSQGAYVFVGLVCFWLPTSVADNLRCAGHNRCQHIADDTCDSCVTRTHHMLSSVCLEAIRL
jgi:hypothetical protein